MNAKYVSLGICVAALVAGIVFDVIPLTVFGLLVLVFWLFFASRERKSARLRAAGAGAVRVETVKAQFVNSTVQQYVKAGWSLDSQSSAKSFGTQAKVTLTFRKSR